MKFVERFCLLPEVSGEVGTTFDEVLHRFPEKVRRTFEKAKEVCCGNLPDVSESLCELSGRSFGYSTGPFQTSSSPSSDLLHGIIAGPRGGSGQRSI